jgi:Na+-transporting NADH:ubiquinone oxidoreductase subunit C
MNKATRDRAWSRDSKRNTVFVAVALSLVCSVLVSAAAVYLRPLQERNAERNRQKIILEVAGLLSDGGSVDEQFRQVEARVVELDTGAYADDLDPAVFDMRAAARDPGASAAIPDVEDIAGIGRRPNHATVYLVRPDGELRYIILPVYGYGLWSTMYGFIALQSDGNTIAGLQFYEQAETPGLGAEIDNPKWRALWRGKMVYGDDGAPKIELIRGAVTATDESARYQVDGLAGSTLTSRGVTNLLHYWLGEDGFAPYLRRVTDAEDNS